MPPDRYVVEVMKKVDTKCVRKTLTDKYGSIDTSTKRLKASCKKKIKQIPIVVFRVGVNEVPRVAAVDMKFAHAKLK